MFARMVIFQFKLENIDDAVRLFRSSAVPGAKMQKGYRGACFLVDRKTGKSVAVTFWRNEKEALANEENRFFQEQLVKFVPFFAGPPLREGYEVSVHVVAKPAKRKKKR